MSSIVIAPSLVNLRDIEIPEDPNPNKMDADTYRSLVHVISDSGSVQPILCYKDEQKQLHLIDGYHRMRAHAELGLPNIYAVVLDECSPAKAKALRIALNKLRGSLDLGIVQQQIQDLINLDAWSIDDTLLTGFVAGDISDMLRSMPEPEVNAALIGSDNPTGLPTDKDEIWEITIDGFASKAAFTKAKAKLKKLAGKGQPLAVGLAALIAAAEDKPKKAAKGQEEAESE